MSRRILRWDVLIQDKPQLIGGGRVVYVGCRPDLRQKSVDDPARRVEVWTEEDFPDDLPLHRFDTLQTRSVTVVGTARPIPDGYIHLGSAVDPSIYVQPVWHIYEKE